MPAAHRSYWAQKIERNIKRDREVVRHYKKIGWNVFRIWGHNITNRKIAALIQKKLQEM